MTLSRPARWTARGLMMLGGGALVLVALEIGLRVSGSGEIAPEFRTLFVRDATLGYRLRPGAHARLKATEFETDIDINPQGVRDDPIGLKAPGEFRVVVLGDSMVMAVQVPPARTFCRLLQQRLNAGSAGPRRYRVINAGVQGYGPVEEYLFFSQMAAVLDPDLVVVTVFAGNDAVEAAAAEPRLAPVPPPPERAHATLWLWARRLARRSAAIQFLRIRLLTELGRSGQAPLRDRPLDSFKVDPPADVVHGFAVARDCVARIASVAAARGARTAVLLLPVRFQLDDADFAALTAEIGGGQGAVARDGATERFRAALQALPLLDLLPLLRALPAPSALYFRDNVHFSPQGHEVVAGALERFLRDRHLLD